MNASEFGCGAGHQLAITVAKAGWELEDFSTLTRSEKKCREVLQFLRGEADLVSKSIIRIDRSIRPSYPDWVKVVMHPELESVGPAEYDISAVEQWLHGGQGDGMWIEGNKIYNHLKKTDTLKTCLRLRDLEEIQKKGIAFFRKHFKEKAVFGWAGIVQGRAGNNYVPSLDGHSGEVVLGWHMTNVGFFKNLPALRFVK